MACIVGITMLSGVAMATGTVHNINISVDYDTIQAAIDVASVGDEIHVDSGIYYENVNVNKRLMLIGIDTGAGKPVVDANGTGSAITLFADGIVLEGFTVVRAFEAGVKVFLRNNTIINNSAFNNTGFGFLLSNSNNNTVKNNNASNNNAGIALTNSKNNIIDRNIINLNQYAGITTDNSDYNMIVGNIVSDNNHGILISGSYNQFIGNIINKSISAGFFISNGYFNTISANTISYTASICIYNYGGAYNKIYHNNFINNNCSRDNPSYWDDGYPSGGNYWSDYLGVDINNDGIGDTPYNINCGDAQDRYPLMNPYNGQLTPQEIIRSAANTAINRYQMNQSIVQQIVAEYPNDPKMANQKLNEIVVSDKKNRTVEAILASAETEQQRIDLQAIIDASPNTGAMFDEVTIYANTHMTDLVNFHKNIEESFFDVKIPDEVVGGAEILTLVKDSKEALGMTVGYKEYSGEIVSLIDNADKEKKLEEKINSFAIPDDTASALKWLGRTNMVFQSLDQTYFYSTVMDATVGGVIKFVGDYTARQVPVWTFREEFRYILPQITGDTILVGTNKVYIGDNDDSSQVYQKDDLSETYFIFLKGKPKEGWYDSLWGRTEQSYWREIVQTQGGNWIIVPIVDPSMQSIGRMYASLSKLAIFSVQSPANDSNRLRI